MSDLNVDLQQANMNIKGLTAQLDATKQMVNEILASNLQFRTNQIILQQAHQEIAVEKSGLMNQVEMHKAEIEVLKAKVLELQPVVSSEEVQPA